MNLYVVRNKQGQFFRAIGYSGSGDNWVDTLDRAKFYAKIGQAKSRVTYFTKSQPKYGCPDILEFTLDVAAARVIDMTETTQKSIRRIAKTELKRQQQHNEWKLSRLKEDYEAIQRKIKELS